MLSVTDDLCLSFPLTCNVLKGQVPIYVSFQSLRGKKGNWCFGLRWALKGTLPIHHIILLLLIMSLQETIFSLGEEHRERCDRINSAFIVQYLPFCWFIHLVKLNVLGA